jgi:putative endonuclease
MPFLEKLRFWRRPQKPVHLERGVLGESAARELLESKGMKFLAANFASSRGEIDLVFRDGGTLVFVEVKTRSRGGWTRPSRAVNGQKRFNLVRTASDYLRLLKDPRVPDRFDVVEVILSGGQVSEVRHIQNCFNSSTVRRPRRR